MSQKLISLMKKGLLSILKMISSDYFAISHSTIINSFETSIGMSLGDLRIIKVLHIIAMRLWGVASVTVLACFLLYWFYGGLLAFALLLFAISGILYNAQDHLVYHPTLPSHSRVFVPRPSSYSLPYESIRYPSKDGTILHLFLIRQPLIGAEAITIVFFHGNAGNMGHRLQNIAGLYRNLSVNILMVEYRGYGLSEGTPSESGMYMDARSSVDYLYSRNDINHKRIIIFGRSLGGAIAIDLVSRKEYADKVWCLIVENTFTNIPDMGRVLLGSHYLRFLPSVFYKNKFLSSRKVRQVAVPSLFICGMADGLVPPVMTESLHSYCGSAFKQMLKIPLGGHNDTWTCKDYYKNLISFLNDAPSGPTILHPSNIHQV